MLMIRPLLRANAWRKRKAQIVIFFIFIVSNIGGWLLEKQTIKPISIQMNEGKATIDIRLLVEPNAKIPVLSRKLQEAVKDAVQSMTGIEVATVNLYIAGVSVPRTANTAE